MAMRLKKGGTEADGLFEEHEALPFTIRCSCVKGEANEASRDLVNAITM